MSITHTALYILPDTNRYIGSGILIKINTIKMSLTKTLYWDSIVDTENDEQDPYDDYILLCDLNDNQNTEND